MKTVEVNSGTPYWILSEQTNSEGKKKKGEVSFSSATRISYWNQWRKPEWENKHTGARATKIFFFFCVNKFAFCLTAVNRRTSSTDAFSNPRPSLIFCCAHISSAEQEEERETECIKETTLEKGLSILAKIAVGLSSDHSQKEEKVRENESLLFIVNVLCHCRHSPVSFEH